MKTRQALTTASIAGTLLAVVCASVAAASGWRVVARASSPPDIAASAAVSVRHPAALALRVRATTGQRLDISWGVVCKGWLKARRGHFYWNSTSRPLFRVLVRRTPPAHCDFSGLVLSLTPSSAPRKFVLELLKQ
jgi:hypothetical protein